jgi:hypothetical protein
VNFSNERTNACGQQKNMLVSSRLLPAARERELIRELTARNMFTQEKFLFLQNDTRQGVLSLYCMPGCPLRFIYLFLAKFSLRLSFIFVVRQTSANGINKSVKLVDFPSSFQVLFLKKTEFSISSFPFCSAGKKFSCSTSIGFQLASTFYLCHKKVVFLGKSKVKELFAEFVFVLRF